MSCLGSGEVLMLAVVVLIIFSASRMGQLGNALGRFIYSFKKAAKGDDLIDVSPSNKRISEKAVEGEVIRKDEASR
jgi:sec-independent protein translocase protein TatA